MTEVCIFMIKSHRGELTEFIVERDANIETDENDINIYLSSSYGIKSGKTLYYNQQLIKSIMMPHLLKLLNKLQL